MSACPDCKGTGIVRNEHGLLDACRACAEVAEAEWECRGGPAQWTASGARIARRLRVVGHDVPMGM